MHTLPPSLSIASLPRLLKVGQRSYGVRPPTSAEVIRLFRAAYGVRVGQEGAELVWSETLSQWLGRASDQLLANLEDKPFDEQLSDVWPVLQDGTEVFYASHANRKGESSHAGRQRSILQDPITIFATTDWDDIALDLCRLFMTPFLDVYAWPWPTFVFAYTNRDKMQARQRLMYVGSAFAGAETFSVLSEAAGYGATRDEDGNPIVTAKEQPLLSLKAWRAERQQHPGPIDWSNERQVAREYRLYAEGWYSAHVEDRMSREAWEAYKRKNNSPVPWHDTVEVERRYRVYVEKWRSRLEARIARAGTAVRRIVVSRGS